MDPKERDRILEQFRQEHINYRPSSPDRKRRRVIGIRTEARIDSSMVFGGRPRSSGGLEELARVASRRRRWGVPTGPAILLSFIPIVLAIVIGATLGALAACITLAAAIMALGVMARWVEVRSRR